ncbi:MAG TPA: nucleotidyltransferase family protein [Opitutaceae bacterium]|nr:nucleotidyltransferase family protein [Opitutaceae bacterium]
MAERCAFVLLAAGAATRMRQAKQLLPVDGTPLVRRAAEAALAVPLAPVVAVLGARAEEIQPALGGLPVHVTVNERWPEGLGSSVAAGVRAALAISPDLDAIVLGLADQPGVTGAHLARLVAARRATGRSLVASLGGGPPQPPALFAAPWFPRLLELRGDAGARSLLQENAAALAGVPLADARDLDTPEDYARFLAEGGGPQRPNTA